MEFTVEHLYINKSGKGAVIIIIEQVENKFGLVTGFANRVVPFLFIVQVPIAMGQLALLPIYEFLDLFEHLMVSLGELQNVGDVELVTASISLLNLSLKRNVPITFYISTLSNLGSFGSFASYALIKSSMSLSAISRNIINCCGLNWQV